MVTSIFFLDFNSPNAFNINGKNACELEGIFLKKLEVFRPSEDVQNTCTVANSCSLPEGMKFFYSGINGARVQKLITHTVQK